MEESARIWRALGVRVMDVGNGRDLEPDDVPGLSFTLDHSHFVFHGMPYEHIALMHPHGTRRHARQTALSQLQSQFDEGTIDFGRIVADLKHDGYDGVMALEVVTTPWLGLNHMDVLTETILLRDRMRGLLA